MLFNLGLNGRMACNAPTNIKNKAALSIFSGVVWTPRCLERFLLDKHLLVFLLVSIKGCLRITVIRTFKMFELRSRLFKLKTEGQTI